jgi:GLPGLI family protein
MKIKISFLILLIYGILPARSQTKGTINYKFIFNDKIMGSTINYVIYFNKDKSIELGVNANIKSGKISENSDMVVTNNKTLFLLKDFKTKQIIFADYLGANPCLINDTLPDFKWTITKEKNKVLNFNCTKAITTFRGRNYIAWYTDDVPVQNGPWKFCGLPGLIIKISDDKQIFNYELTGINLRVNFKDNIINIPNDYRKDKPITQKDYLSRYKRKVANNAKMARIVYSGTDGSSSTVTNLLPEKQEKF